MLARMVDGTFHGISINGKSEHERLIGPEGKDGLTMVRATELVMYIGRVSSVE